MCDNAITRNAKELAGLADKIAASERTGCSCCDPTHDSPDPVVQRLERELEALKRDRSDLSDDIARLHSGLRGIKREFGGHSINNGTCTLGQFIDMLIQNDTRAAKRLAKELEAGHER